MSEWGWPQWTMATITLAGLLWSAHEHGKPRRPESFWITLVAAALQSWITWAGGFWGKP